MRRPLMFLCVCLFVLIALFMHFFSPPPWNDLDAVSAGQRVWISGQIYDKEYGMKEGREIIFFYLQNVLISGEALASRHGVVQENNQKSLMKIPQKVKYEMYADEFPCLEEDKVYLPCLGNRIVVSGEWRTYQSSSNPGEFDVAKYYAIEGLCGYLSDCELQEIDKGCYWPIRDGLHRLRQVLVKRLYDVFEVKEASILAKMLLGDGSGLDPEIRELYQENGIVHILSISGLHISMIGMGLYHLLKRCSVPMKGAALIGGIFVVLYGILTGFGVSACRAVGMYLIHMLGEIWNKTYDMLTAMGVLLLGMVMVNPRLVYHSGYLLSFASVCGVGMLAPILPKGGILWPVRPYDTAFQKWRKKRLAGICEGFRISLAVTLSTLPLQLFFFYKIPVYAVFVNLLVIPFVGLVMVIGLLVLFLPFTSFLCPLESAIFTWFEWCCRFFECLPGHMLLTGRPDFAKILLYYIGLWGIVFFGKRMKRIGVIGGLCFCVLFLVIRFQRESKVTFLDVGQGDCICVQTADGKSFLFDGGSSSKTNVGERIILPFLQYEGISSLDGVFLSHPDEDHVNGVLQLLRERDVSIKMLILPDVAEREQEFETILQVLKEKDTEVIYVSEGMYLEGDDLKVSCVHPPKEYEGDDNAYSACYYLELNQTQILLTGDVEEEGEEILTNVLSGKGICNVDILKVAHHGSGKTTSESFLKTAVPKVAIISCGINNRYGHPHAETIERLERAGSRIFVTSEYGAITIICKQDGTVIRCFCMRGQDK